MGLFCKTITDYGSSNGAMPLLYSLRDCIPFAFDGLLLTIFLIIFAGNYFLNKSRTGRSKILIAGLTSSIFTTILSVFLAMTQLITFLSVIFYAFLSIVIFILFELTDTS